MKIVFSGGGTGGHIYPALAIKQILRQKYNFASGYVGVRGGMEEKIVSRETGIEFFGVRAQGMPRSLSPKWLSFPFVNLAGISDALGHLRKFSPDLVVTTGGFVAFPVLAAARMLGLPAVIHEQNAAMGVTNRLFAGSARKVLLTYAAAAPEDGKRVVVTGNPVRSAFLEQKPTSQRFARRENEFVILTVGGSRGALSINRACIELVKTWLIQQPQVRLIHITGERDYDMVKNEIGEIPANYQLLPYLHEMKDAFDAADLLISRAGATILAEIAVCRKPAILVPFPFATDNHQEKNARVLAEMGAASLLLDRDLNAASLVNLLNELRNDNKLAKMAEASAKSRPDDVEARILNQISELLDKC
ncbi:MAG: undecaprenyldiphospho-muramoylpentapeptide beta-N-acetylglucosaminyltransferase [Candidatus Riflebacteria bacterium HGW-Riflebacteria-2]|jgi:UDP-N-acetylglucosamine--N-acetylmuramyl-(pentapeptide) pyrophosphoryl-undecaprenol N-acetylglucosamine transferase|nr:MAG: undecaprenyldiphospho-muramoylpentapeptide beta-N-acetylglucosaminyltransferase [Candidatus Riflebacteria bacterium HGW-Riflebacteria-2]